MYFWSGVLGVALAIIIFASADVLPNLFTADESVKLAATDGLRFLAIALIPGAIAFGGDGVLIGLSDSRFLGIAAFAHTAIMALALFSESIRTGPGLSNLGSPGALDGHQSAHSYRTQPSSSALAADGLDIISEP